MKKIGLGALILSLVIVLSGCGKEKEIEQNANQAISQEITAEGQVDDSESESSMIGRLKNAISSGKKMKCVYKINSGEDNTEVITYVQGDKYKTEMVLGQMKTFSIFDGDVMYSWLEGQKTGTKMDMECVNGLGAEEGAQNNETGKNVSVEDEEGFVESLSDAQSLQCEDADDINFDIPSDINFTDQCELLKNQQRLMEGLNK